MRKDFPELEQRQSSCKILKKMSKFWTGSKPEHLLFFFFFGWKKPEHLLCLCFLTFSVCMLVGHICDLCQQLNL